jgi:hypothetical protein
VIGDGNRYDGIEAIRAWRKEVPLVTCTVHDGSDGEAAVDIAGDFPGSPVRLTFAFGCNAQHASRP